MAKTFADRASGLSAGVGRRDAAVKPTGKELLINSLLVIPAHAGIQ